LRIGFLRSLDRAVESRKSVFAPICFAYLSAYLEKYGGYTDFFIEDDVDALIAKKPDLVGINAYTQTASIASRAAFRIKQRLSIPIILGGPHITALPESLPGLIDAGVMGEGEDTFLDLVNLHRDNSWTADSLAKIKGVVYHHNNQRIVNCSREVIKDIDLVPPPKLELFDYYANEQFTYAIHTSRGCPYKCTFCAAGGITVKTRYHSPERVITDIQNIERVRRANTPQSIIYITDDLFALNKKRIKEIVSLIRQEGLHKKFGFTCHARADIFNREMALLLKEMNMVYISFGMESGSNNVLKSIKAESCDVRKNQRALDICKEMNIGTGSYFMVGAPEETVEDMAQTYWFIFNNKNHLNAIDITQMTPLPGTELWDNSVKNKKVDLENMNFDKFDFGLRIGDVVFINEHYSQEFINENYKKFRDFKRYILSRRSSVVQDYGFLGSEAIGQYEGQNLYEKNIYQEILKLIPSSVSSVLEVNPHYRELERHTDKFSVNWIKPGILPENVSEKSFDLLLFDHSLEQIRDYEKYLQNVTKYLKDDGYFLFLIYNAQHLENIIDSFFGYFTYNIYGVNQFENLQHFSLPQFANLLKRNQIQVLDQILYRFDSVKYSEEVRQDAKKIIGFDNFSDYFSFLLLGRKNNPLSKDLHNA